jgi:hypothetical protein
MLSFRLVNQQLLTYSYANADDALQTRDQPLSTMASLLQRPPLAMFDPSLIHRNGEIFNPEPNRLGIFFILRPACFPGSPTLDASLGAVFHRAEFIRCDKFAALVSA